MECPKCGRSKTIQVKDNLRRCKLCKNVHFVTITPFHSQLNAIYDEHRVVCNVGAYGTGKTVSVAFYHLLVGLEVKRGRCVLMAASLQQLYDTTYTELISMLPDSVMVNKAKFTGSTAGEVRLVNGFTYLLKPSESAHKIRSLNILCANIEEADGVDEAVFKELGARLRQAKDVDPPDKDERENMIKMRKYSKITLTSNPSDTWVIRNIVAKSHHIGNYTKHSPPESGEVVVGYSSYITSTDRNPYVQQSYIDMLYYTHNDKVEQQIYIEGNLNLKLGRIFSNINALVVDPIDKSDYTQYMSIFGLDLGAGTRSGDKEAFMHALVDPSNGYVFVVGEVAIDDNITIEERVKSYNKYVTDNNINKHLGIYVDNIHSSKASGHGDNEKLIDKYERKGLMGLYSARNAKFNKRERIKIAKDFINSGKLHISSDCENLISELKEYSWRTNKDGTYVRTSDPTKGSDHFIDCLYFILLEVYDIEQKLEYSNEDLYRLKLKNHIRYSDPYKIYKERIAWT